MNIDAIDIYSNGEIILKGEGKSTIRFVPTTFNTTALNTDAPKRRGRPARVVENEVMEFCQQFDNFYDTPSWFQDVVVGAARLNESEGDNSKPLDSKLLWNLLSYTPLFTTALIESMGFGKRYSQRICSCVISAMKSIQYHMASTGVMMEEILSDAQAWEVEKARLASLPKSEPIHSPENPAPSEFVVYQGIAYYREFDSEGNHTGWVSKTGIKL